MEKENIYKIEEIKWTNLAEGSICIFIQYDCLSNFHRGSECSISSLPDTVKHYKQETYIIEGEGDERKVGVINKR